ncbi:MAG: hypothetical protein WKF30_15170 [Pyrinomonadaceae bacterium]
MLAERKAVCLLVNEQNIPAQRLYRKAGYAVAVTRRFVFNSSCAGCDLSNPHH